MIIDHTKNIVELKDISFSYGKENVLNNISFQVHKGDYLGVIGPNGAGKTTLLKIILGLIKPDSGIVSVFCKKIGYVAQKAINFDANFPVTVKEVVGMGLCKKNKQNKFEINEVLKKVNMAGFENKMIGDLSGGQQQKVFLARALIDNPEIIFLDEPTTGIDKKSQDDFYKIIKDLNENQEITIVLVTHDIERITKEAMHIVCVDKTLVCHTSPTEFLENSEKIIGYHHH